MGIYVKGMRMPRSCFECKLDLRTDVCQAFCEWNAEHPYSIRGKDRLPDCPLVEVPEPHGRLVDADVLMNVYTKHEFSSDMGDAMEVLDNFPTVIEAEGE